MDDTGLVPRFERFRDLPRDRNDVFDRDRAFLDPLGERRPFHELQHERSNAVRFLESMDARNVRMVQRCEKLRLALEPRETIGVLRKRMGKHLDRDITVELRVARAVHLPHTAFAERREDLVGS